MESASLFPLGIITDEQKSYYQALLKGLETLLKIYPLTPENNWVIIEKKEEYTIYSKSDKETGFNWSRGETIIEKEGQEIIDYINDIARKKEWDQLFQEGKTIEKINDSIFLSYQRFKPIFPAGARDFLMAVGTFPTKENLLTLVVVSIEKSEFPPDKSYTRAHLHLGGWVLEKLAENKTKVTYHALVDPKGWLPKSVVNFATKNQALCVDEIRKQLDKK